MSDHDTTPGAPETEALAAVLAEHPGYTSEVNEERSDEFAAYWEYRCSGRTCRELFPSGGFADAKYRAHVAAALLASDWLATRDAAQRAAGAETALREAADALIQGWVTHGQHPGASATRGAEQTFEYATWLRDRADRIGGAS